MRATSHKWTWTPPSKNNQGYLVVIEAKTPTKKQTASIAVDVSENWDKFPRYGFLSAFPSLSQDQIAKTIARLNRYHINGLQFYDWSAKHHQPLTVASGKVPDSWTDIANRQIEKKTILSYIDEAHRRQMKAMSYNLIYGALANSEQDGTQRSWFLFKDPDHDQVDVNSLPDGWKSAIYLMNPANQEWQNYLTSQQKNIYTYLPFDGWHIDQLGDRGKVYNSDGQPVALADSFTPFLSRIKTADPNKSLVMNAVGQFGQSDIAKAPVDFLYTEVWDDNDPDYFNLKQIIDTNAKLSSGKKNSVLAAYMDYDHSGHFNEAGVLLTDSVIFASDGAHLELGEHMLSKEYFPNHDLTMTASLSSQLVHYYDFLTAYETLLRDDVENAAVRIHSNKRIPISNVPTQGHLWVFAKKKAQNKIIHFINFLDANSIKWRDRDGTQPTPQIRHNLDFTLDEAKPIKSVWLASPDRKQGQPIPLRFKQKSGRVHIMLPTLRYWDMLVFDYR
ncbi:glycoside hydrolase family 66 protein [Sporolactobacillus shoreicorticis]|uniref:Glycoside hydrolase family 66 protein n=1 Tax=Sporolactobacillus shoreicorticis TaxID=1923877 RepID=A0ABW5S7M9_9BACL|nr:glycoside hydrolase family 66 protein [Sporolactobacillus shoreicorticis]MCO7125608.1 glycoside hydrolase family 66 protein [Sporolactobacillus shoreicorticis]